MAFPFNHHCHFKDCNRTTSGFEGYCREYCGQVYCVEHRKPPFHPCWEYIWTADKRSEAQEIARRREIREWIRLQTSLDKTLIRSQASALRPGHECDIDMPDEEEVKGWNENQQAENWKKYVKGGLGGRWGTANQHYRLTFDDGVRWVLRCRRLRDDLADKNILRVVMDSEISTMQELWEKGVRVPRPYRPPALPFMEREEGLGGIEKGEAAPVSGTNPTTPSSSTDLYFFMEYVSGKPFPVGSLAIQTKQVDKLIAEGRLTGSILDNFATAIARQMIKVSEIKFTSNGSLYPSADGRHSIIGPAINSISGFPEPPYFRGPFKTAREKWTSAIDHQLDLILNHGQHGKNGPYCYLTYLDLKDMVEQCEELGREEVEYFIHNIDTKGQQFMITENGEITTWLDWEWTVLTTKEEAFASPHVFGGRGFLLDLTAWELRLVEIYKELGRPDLAECVKGGTKYHWLTLLCYPASGLMPHIQHHQQLRHLMLGDVEPVLLRGEAVKPWVEGLKEKYKDVPEYQQLLSRESAGVGSEVVRTTPGNGTE